MLNNAPAGTIEWTVTAPFIVSGNGTTVTVARAGTGTSTGNGSLTASVNGTTVASKTITPCQPPTITGPTLICYGSPQDFTVSNAPQGYTWDKSSNLNLSGTGSSVSISSSSSTNDSFGWVAVKSSTGEELVRYPVWVGLPTISITGPTNPALYSSQRYTASPISSLSSPTSYSWWFGGPSPNNSYMYQGGTNWVQVTFNDESYYQLTAAGTNTCGQGTTRLFYIIVGGPFWSSAYPNPASDILNIEIDTQSQSSAPAITTGTQLKMDKTYNLRLYDNQGTILRNAKTKGGTVQFNVQNLPDGIYYLHIYDGVNPKPEMQQIVVEH